MVTRPTHASDPWRLRAKPRTLRAQFIYLNQLEQGVL
jgi:hypothetical protein